MTAKRSVADDDSFVVSALHRHLKERLTAYSGATEYARGKRAATLDALGFLDGVSDGRYPSPLGGAE